MTQNPGVSDKGKKHCQGPTGGAREGDSAVTSAVNSRQHTVNGF